jgi:hypothetical protein
MIQLLFTQQSTFKQGGSLKSKSKTTSLILLSVVISLIFGYVTYRQLKVGDFADHIVWARDLSDKGYVFIPPHALFEQLVVTVRVFVPFNIFVKASKLLHQIIDIKSYEISEMIVVCLLYVAVAILIFTRLTKDWKASEKKFSSWFVGAITVVAMLVGPIFLFTFPERMYLGYITGNPFHNPTHLLLRPFALLLFYHAFSNLYSRPNFWNTLFAGILIIAATQSKANFTLTFLPTIGLLALIQFRKLREVNWQYLIFGLGIPGVITLVLQYYISFTGERVDSIIFAPFRALLLYVPNVGILFLFILLSILFPIAITLLYWKETRSDLRLLLAWLNFLVALVMACLFTQVINIVSLNFWWGVMIATFILFVETIWLAGKYDVFAVREQTGKVKRIIVLTILGLHLLCGIIYYFNSILFPASII